MDIGNKIKRLRLQLNLSQAELADRCELTKGYISQLENDLTEPSISTLHGMLLKWIIPNAQKNEMEPVLVELLAGASTSVDFPHEGEEFGYVLEGRICLELGKKKYICKKGETFYYAADKSHNISNNGNGTAKFLWISTPPNF